MSKGSIADPRLRIVASKKFCDYVQKHLADEKNLPENIARICGKISKSSQEENIRTYPSVIYTESEKKLLITAEEVAENPPEEKKDEKKTSNNKEKTKKEQIITVQDVKWLNGMLQEKRATASEPVYLHELLESCSVLLPENPVIERSPELEKRCETLRKEQENRNYRKMTRNVENYRSHPYEDSISYQSSYIFLDYHLKKPPAKQFLFFFQSNKSTNS